MFITYDIAVASVCLHIWVYRVYFFFFWFFFSTERIGQPWFTHVSPFVGSGELNMGAGIPYMRIGVYLVLAFEYAPRVAVHDVERNDHLPLTQHCEANTAR